MDPEDEALIRKFAGLQAGEQEEETVVSIPLQATSARNWKLCLVVKVLTDRAVFDAQFERAMRRVWGLYPASVFKMVDRGFYLIECSTEGEYERILNEGPWSYRQDLVLAAECPSPNHLNDSGLKHAEAWVQFHNLPIDSLTEEGLLMVTKKVGTAISDPLHAHFNGKQYTRIKMLLQLEKPLRDYVTVRHPALGDVKVHLVYERVDRICLFCGAIGHEMGSCSDRLKLAKIRLKHLNSSRPDLDGILKPTRGKWINNQAMLPQGDEVAGPNSQGTNLKAKHGGTVGSKRALQEVSHPLMGSHSHGVRITEQPSLNLTDEVLSENEEEGEILTPKRARAARASPPASS